MDISGQHVGMQTGLNWLTIISGAFDTSNDVSTSLKIRFILEQLIYRQRLMFDSGGIS
jgi:hypothetical protein